MNARSWERIERICESGGDAMRLRLDLVDEIRRAMGFDAYAFLLTDPQTSVGSAPLADVPCTHELPRLIRHKYLTSVNRWTSVTRVALLQQATGGQPSRSQVWREVLASYDIGDVASLVFRDRFGCWGFLDLWRAGASARFSQAEAEFLSRVTVPVATALRHCQAQTFAARGSHRPRVGPIVLLLSRDLEVIGQTAETQEYLRILVPAAEGRSPIPASAYNVAAQLLANEAGVDTNPPSARVHLADGLWLTLRAATIADVGSVSAGHIAVSIEECSPSQRVSVFARTCGLSDRESELLGHLVTGNDTRDIARLMFVSDHTVQDHLKSIFAKTATRNRRSLISRAVGG